MLPKKHYSVAKTRTDADSKYLGRMRLIWIPISGPLWTRLEAKSKSWDTYFPNYLLTPFNKQKRLNTIQYIDAWNAKES